MNSPRSAHDSPYKLPKIPDIIFSHAFSIHNFRTIGQFTFAVTTSRWWAGHLRFCCAWDEKALEAVLPVVAYHHDVRRLKCHAMIAATECNASNTRSTLATVPVCSIIARWLSENESRWRLKAVRCSFKKYFLCFCQLVALLRRRIHDLRLCLLDFYFSSRIFYLPRFNITLGSYCFSISLCFDVPWWEHIASGPAVSCPLRCFIVT